MAMKVTSHGDYTHEKRQLRETRIQNRAQLPFSTVLYKAPRLCLPPPSTSGIFTWNTGLLYVCLSICTSIYLYMYFCLSVSLTDCLCLSVCLSVCYLGIYLSYHLSIYLDIYLSKCLSEYLSIYHTDFSLSM